jgi:hypothetical protein
MPRFSILIISAHHPDGIIERHHAASCEDALMRACRGFDALPRPAVAKVWTKIGGKAVVWRRQPRKAWGQGEVIRLRRG